MNPETFRRLVAAGLTTEQIAVVFDVMDERERTIMAAEEARKANARDRVQRWRDRQKQAVTLPKRNGNATERLTRVEDSSSNLELDRQKERKKDFVSPKAQPKNGCRIPNDFVPDIQWAVNEGMSLDEADTAARQFQDYWHAKAGKDARKQDWPRTWQVWVRNAMSRRPTARAGPPPKPLSVGEMFREDARKAGLLDDQPPSDSNGRMETSHGGRQNGGTSIFSRIAQSADIFELGPGGIFRRT